MAVDAARAKSLFLAASDLADPAERAAYLDRECGDDADLRGRVESLLRANDAAPLPPAEAANGTSAHVSDRLPQTEDHGDPTARIGAILAGKYKLIEEIGAGGMGSVFMAQQIEPVKRAVAVKVIKAGMDSKAVLARFEAERQALALMDHPNIAKVLDAGTTDGGRPFFVMELVKGTPITQFCDERKLTPRQRLELFVPVCQAIQHAHQKGIIHRDIKPSNVLVTLYDDRPVPKVIDFGVAKATATKLTERTLVTGFGALIGTLEYMSPEQAELKPLDIDTRSDVYSLGVLLYELLTGQTPLGQQRLKEIGLLEMLRRLREEETVSPSARLRSLPDLPFLAEQRRTGPARLVRLVRDELDWIVMKSLEKDRNRRYETAAALAEEIRRYLHDEPVQAGPPSAGYRLSKFLKRNRGRRAGGGGAAGGPAGRDHRHDGWPGAVGGIGELRENGPGRIAVTNPPGANRSPRHPDRPGPARLEPARRRRVRTHPRRGGRRLSANLGATISQRSLPAQGAASARTFTHRETSVVAGQIRTTGATARNDKSHSARPGRPSTPFGARQASRWSGLRRRWRDDGFVGG